MTTPTPGGCGSEGPYTVQKRSLQWMTPWLILFEGKQVTAMDSESWANQYAARMNEAYHRGQSALLAEAQGLRELVCQLTKVVLENWLNTQQDFVDECNYCYKEFASKRVSADWSDGSFPHASDCIVAKLQSRPHATLPTKEK